MGHRGTLACQKTAVSFRRHLYLIFFQHFYKYCFQLNPMKEAFSRVGHPDLRHICSPFKNSLPAVGKGCNLNPPPYSWGVCRDTYRKYGASLPDRI